jgi:TatA/E family protein of Tat protein translocase
MFDNPEKLFILFVIALMILGPSKLASLGSSLGRSIRDFRSAVRGAHDEFRSAVQEHVDGLQEHVSDVQGQVQSLAPALPAPDPEPMPDPAAAMPVDYGAGVVSSVEPVIAAAAAQNRTAAAPSEDDPSSLASEPTAAELRKAGAH